MQSLLAMARLLHLKQLHPLLLLPPHQLLKLLHPPLHQHPLQLPPLK